MVCKTLFFFRTYLGLLKIGIPTVKGNCVPQLERILRKSTARRRRRRLTSTASNQIGSVSEDDGILPNGTMSQPESAEDEASITVYFKQVNA